MHHYPLVQALSVIAGILVSGVHLLLQKELKKLFLSKPTLKYQVIVHHSTRKLLHIYGPFKRSVYNAKVYEKSEIAEYLLNYNLKLIRNKAHNIYIYIGNFNVIAPIKKNNRYYNKAQQRRYNLQLA
jgi:hypothetical protein